MNLKNNNFSILISSAGRRVELLKIWEDTVRSYFGKTCKIICSDMNPEYSAACQISKNFFSIEPISQRSYIESLLKKCIQNKIKLIIPTIDTELKVLSENKEYFSRNEINILISETEFIDLCSDKISTSTFFNSFEANTPKLFEKSNLTYPCFMKPISGSSSIGTKKLFSKDDLSKSDYDNNLNIFQELIEDDYKEYSCDLYYNKEGILCSCIVRERISTRSGEISKGITRKNNIYEYVIEKFKKIKIARGPITLQLFANKIDEDIKCIEINPRFGGGYPMSHQAGGDFPALIIKEYFEGKELEFTEDWQKDLLMLRYDSTF